MRKLFITVCELDEISFLPNGAESELFSAPLYEHAYRKIKDAANKLDLDVEFVRAATFPVRGATNEFNPDFEDIVAVVSPLVFLAHARTIEDAISFVIKNDPAYATVGHIRSLFGVFGLGKMVSGGVIGSCHDFINHINESGAICKSIALAEGEKAVPVSRIEYLKRVEAYREELLDYLVMTGVEIETREGVTIAPNTEIRRGTVIHRGTKVGPWTVIKEKCEIGPDTVIDQSMIGERCTVKSSYVIKSTLEDGVNVSPFSHIKDSKIFSGVEIGSFVNVDGSVIGMDTRVEHHSHIGDCDTGSRVIIGVGVATVNHYSNKDVRRCKLGDDVTVGCGANLIAPLNIGAGAFVAAGSTITDDVPSNALAIARQYQKNRDGWAKKRRKTK